MMGERRVMQALFDGFSPERHVPDRACCARSTGSSIFRD